MTKSKSDLIAELFDEIPDYDLERENEELQQTIENLEEEVEYLKSKNYKLQVTIRELKEQIDKLEDQNTNLGWAADDRQMGA